MTDSERMSAFELKSAVSLASIYGLRMLGMFLILPVFVFYAEHELAANHTQAGLALGIYGLTQAALQLPFGMASDRWGRKRVIYFGLALFALGSFIAAISHDIRLTILGRAIQGSGAISAAVTALLADLTREEHRTKAMAMIGGTIGVTFAVSLIAGPAFYHWIGVPGIFAMTGVLALLAMAVVRFVVPNPRITRFHSDTEATPARLKDVLKNVELLRLNFGIFALHAAQMALFVVIPLALKKAGNIDQNHHWMIYLPIMVLSFVLMVPAIIYGEKKFKLKEIFVAAIALMLVTQLFLAGLIDDFRALLVLLTAYFVSFNLLEATLPSLISKIAPASAKGTAIGVYNAAQSFGMFLGGAMGGALSQHYGPSAVFLFCSLLIGIWLIAASRMQRPPAVRTRLFHVREMEPVQAAELARRLAALGGVAEAVVVGEEGVAILKVDQRGWDEAGVMKLIEEEREHGVSQ
ncbi:MFS transporter [Thiobacter aerophilum]|uniref:MFS transporter n=1 Tax=Thiobacter aerophilum TaxID=3121275 RepID=A0ABV0ECH1_9BURK